MSEIETYQARTEVALSGNQDAAVQRLGEWAHSAQAAYQVAENLVRTSFVPEGFRGKPHEATAAILSGLEVGLSPMAALRSFDVIQGTAAPRAVTLRAIVQSKGHEVDLIESNATRCVMEGTRRGSSKAQRVVWTMDRAKQLGLTGKANWKNQPQAMLLARATSEICRLIAADAILGIAYTSEEIADGGSVEQAAATGSTDATPTGTRRMSRPARQAPAESTEQAVTAEQGAVEPDQSVEESPYLNPQSSLAKRMFATMNEASITDKDQRLAYVSEVIGREVTTSKEMTDADASLVIDVLRHQLENPEQQAADETDTRDHDPDPTLDENFGGQQ